MHFQVIIICFQKLHTSILQGCGHITNIFPVLFFSRRQMIVIVHSPQFRGGIKPIWVWNLTDCILTTVLRKKEKCFSFYVPASSMASWFVKRHKGAFQSSSLLTSRPFRPGRAGHFPFFYLFLMPLSPFFLPCSQALLHPKDNNRLPCAYRGAHHSHKMTRDPGVLLGQGQVRYQCRTKELSSWDALLEIWGHQGFKTATRWAVGLSQPSSGKIKESEAPWAVRRRRPTT